MARIVLFILAAFLSACGSGGSGDSNGPPPPPAPSNVPTRLELFAGSLGGSGNVDGTATVARFNYPSAVAADAAGNLYVADTNNFAIRKIDANGNVSTLAGSPRESGNADGTGAAARFFYPSGIATDASDNVYVTDPGNKNVRKVTAAGVVTTLAGSGLTGSVDGAGAVARFVAPKGPAVDRQGNVYVADAAAIRRITPAGVVSTLAGVADEAGSTDGQGAAARFSAPMGIAIDAAGRMYVADNRLVRLVLPSGEVSTLAGNATASGGSDGFGNQASFSSLVAITVDAGGIVYVIDSANAVPSIRRITPDGSVTTVAPALDYGLVSLASRANGLVAADQLHASIKAIGFDGRVTTLAGSVDVAAPQWADGTGTAARLGYVGQLAADSAGNLFAAESYALRLRRITRDAVVTTLVAGNTVADPFAAASSAAVDRNGNVYFGTAHCTFAGRGSLGSCTGQIRKIDPAGVVSTLTGATYPESTQVVPESLATDASGNLFVADAFNCVVHRITPAGNISVLAGTVSPFFCASSQTDVDGVGPAARFVYPRGIATDAAGNVYVTEAQGHTVRRITADGVVTTLAGMGGKAGDADGAGAAARFSKPWGITVDDNGNVYVADTGNQLVRKITPSGVVTTVAGTSGIIGFVPGPLPGVLAAPTSVAVVGSDLFIGMIGGVAVVHDRP